MTVHEGSRAPRLGGKTYDIVNAMNTDWNGSEVKQTFTAYAEQTNGGALYNFGDSDNKGLIAGTQPVLVYPSNMAVGNNWSGNANYNDGSSEHYSYSITKLEAVGNQMAYKIHSTISYSDGSSESSNEWFVPNIGFPIKATVMSDDSNGHGEATVTLSQKNF